MSGNTLLYTQEHEWINYKNGIATIGITKHAVDELGEIVFIELPEENSNTNQQEEFGTVESVKTVSSLYSPLTGEVTEINSNLNSQPNLINDDPYNEGWIIKIKATDESELDDLMTQEEYDNFIETL
jgi:glycine cleavage system H protein